MIAQTDYYGVVGVGVGVVVGVEVADADGLGVAPVLSPVVTTTSNVVEADVVTVTLW